MVDLVLRPSGRDHKPWTLQLRYHDLGGTDYVDVAHVSDKMACELVRAGEVSWLFDRARAASEAGKARVEGNITPPDIWPLGTRVRKVRGSSWQGHVVGYYATKLNPAGYCVESEREPGSVQIYPAAALTKETGE